MTLKELVAEADVLIESAGPGVLEDQGLGYEALAAINEALIYVSLTAFGADGPKAQWAATDLIIAAACGFLSLTGDEDRPPVRISTEQVYLHAGLEAVAGILAALYDRDHHSGRGQYIDVSAAESFLLACQFQMLGGPLAGTSALRVSGGAMTGPVRLRFVWPCLDGHVVVAFAFGSALGRFARNLMEWVFEAGFCDEAMRDKDWLGYGLQLLTGEEPITEWERVKEAVGRFFLSRTKAELTEGALTRRVALGRVSTVTDVLADKQFAARKVFSDADRLAVPATFALFNGVRMPLPERAPALGSTDVSELIPRPVQQRKTLRTPYQADGTGGALSGLRVLDLGWVMAGAAGGRILADYGATVVRVESATHVDTIRTLGPYRDDNYDAEFSGPYNCANAGKLGLALNLSLPESRDVLADLVRWADVVLENYAPGAMARMGFGIDVLRQLNSRAVVVSSSLLGQTGPMAGLAGFGNMGAALAGFTEITGWPDRDPAGPFSAYTDALTPRFLAIAALAALLERNQTGKGVHVDLSQTESAVQLLAPSLLDAQVTGRVLGRAGNDDPMMTPHGVFAASGGGWLAVACRDDRDWAALATVLDRTDLKGLGVEDRRRRRTEIDASIGRWAAELSTAQATNRLQAIGVPAHGVQGVKEVYRDPQFVHRQYFRAVPHPTQPGGSTWIESHRPRLSRTPASFLRAGPIYGQDSEYVLRDLLGYSDQQITNLAVAGALE
jgi:crotonobetainyl-CoA:carnitine CoA-transferase CaiB-like acyl-CoA transferase